VTRIERPKAPSQALNPKYKKEKNAPPKFRDKINKRKIPKTIYSKLNKVNKICLRFALNTHKPLNTNNQGINKIIAYIVYQKILIL